MKVVNDMTNPTPADLTSIAAALDRLQADVAVLSEQKRRRDEMFGELTPILREMMDSMTPSLQGMDERGYFDFVRALGGVADQVVTGFTPQDVRELGGAVVSILETVRHMTQPAVLDTANEAVDVLEHPEKTTPVGLYGMMKASKDPDVRRGFGVLVEVLKRVGKGAESASTKRRSISERLAPRRRALPPRPPQTAAPAATPAAVPKHAAACLTPEAELVPYESWDRIVGQQIATALGLATLTDEQWHLVEWCRAEFLSSGKSPNLRKISSGSGVTTRMIYTLFPQRPGLTVAQIGGIPKPVGCI
ncbi:MAG: sulfur relay (sulfurtransferase) DsrC/TusE family protein [Myxococcota bacterium]|jgi:sulfur relay (sulfurtransferase) DsrC/TusE family protein/uncharacterized protein YjgD (DUF1641 family)